MSSQAICGVKFASLKKFANYLFENSVETGKLHNRSTYVIIISLEVYTRKKKEVERFEDEFFVTVKGV
jgi:hypothetical protein